MSNEQPTCLAALRAEIGSVAIDLEKRLERRVAQVEQAFFSMERNREITAALGALADMVKELQAKLDDSEQRRMATEDDYGKLVGEYEDMSNRLVQTHPSRVTAEELFVKFKPFVYDLLKCIYHMTSPAVSSLQYGAHHGHQTLHKHIVKYRRFVDNLQEQNNTDYFNDVPDEVLRALDKEGIL